MDKVKQVLKYQFWILLVVALILPLVGWSMATSGLVSEAAVRAKTLKDLNDSLKVNPDDPNTTWEQGLQGINQIQGTQSSIAQNVLYEHQLPLMVWPDRMPSDPSQINSVLQEFARTSYRDWVDQVRQVVKPYDEGSESGLVEYSEDLLPRPDLEEWVQMPSVKQIEAAQEDLWLLTSMLKAIASVNIQATTRFDAPIRRIEELYLRGGSKGAGGRSSMPSPMSASGATGASGAVNAQQMMLAMRGGGSSARESSAGPTAIASVKINPDDDLGPEATAGGGMGGTRAGGSGDAKPAVGASAGHGGTPSAMVMPSSGGSGGTGGRWGGSNVGRYREEKPEWKTRGFYLEVVMDHRRVPDLLVALANADWPVNVLRVQMGDYQDEDLADADGGMAGGMMGGRSGSPMAPGMNMRAPAAPRGGASGPAGHGGGPVGRAATPMPARGARPSEEGAADTGTSSRSAFDDPNLANVAIVGTIYIFNKPKPTPVAPGGAPGATTPANSIPPAAAATGTPAAETTGEAVKPEDVSESEPKSAQPAEDKESESDKPADPATDAPESKSPADKQPAASGKSDQSN